MGGVTKTWSYGYDGADRLVSANDGQASSFGYDVFGNRRTVVSPTGTLAYVYDASHQLGTIRSGGDTGTLIGAAVHDAAGRMTRLCEGAGITINPGTCSGASVLAMDYAANDQLVSAVRTGAGATSQSYVYDHAGRRVRKTVGVGLSATTTHYVYQGDAIHSEHVGSLSAPGAVLVHGPGTDEPLMRLTGTTTTPSATARYYLADGLGSVVGLVGEFSAGGPVAATSVSSTGNFNATAYPAASVINGDTTDGSGIWAGNTGASNASSLTVELGSVKALSRVTVHGASTFNLNHVVRDASIQVRDAGNNWITVGAIGNNTTELSPSVSFATTQASAVRVQFAQARAAGQPVIVAEVSVSNDGGAQSQASQRFDAWGATTQASGAIPLSGYTGREPDGTGLMHYRARSYHPALGRFTSKDAMGMIDAVSPYAYVANSPTMATDPSGEILNFIGGAAINVGIGALIRGGIDYAQTGSLRSATAAALSPSGLALDAAVGAATSGLGALAAARRLDSIYDAAQSRRAFTGEGGLYGVAQVTGTRAAPNYDHAARSIFEAERLVQRNGGAAYLDTAVSRVTPDLARIAGPGSRPDVTAIARNGAVSTVEVASVSQQSASRMLALQAGQDAIQAALSGGLRGSTSVIPYGSSALNVGDVYGAFYVNRVLGAQGAYQGLTNGFGSLPASAAPYNSANQSTPRPGKP